MAYPHSIPTPPFSPQHPQGPSEQIEDPLKSTISLLDSLVAFYQHERMWVYRTRATLENAFADPPLQQNITHNQPHAYPLSSPTASSLPSSASDFSGFERDEGSSATPEQQPTPWMRRKKGFKLRLDGLAPRNRRVISTHPVDQHQPVQENSQPREHILELFEKMMESRMESCQRVNKLVRNANRANLHIR
ncbi:hypothetical protein BDQ12DRAFT_674932 [Crucibulum laeve]|uniref:Uncharacterized protein n=1 Tax=Crucibulum laeve TaxID=68775 RepID=A0A5C3MQB9_9AGAR|nr:hypothetical protein BDQ12DRAFT_674932 [Crucibulum laeve]